jgi:hypothetical protein
MSAHGRSLARLAGLYGLVEHARALELGVASSAVDEVERAERQELAVQQRCGRAAVEALAQGDRLEWGLALRERETAQTRTRRLEALRLEREQLREAAREAFSLSRLEMEQMQSAVDRVRRAEELEESRRAQAVADDRFLSRREWSKGQDALREDKPEGSSVKMA